MKHFLKIGKFGALIILLTLLGIWLGDAYVKRMAKPLVYDDLQTVPHNKVGLVLGTIKT